MARLTAATRFDMQSFLLNATLEEFFANATPVGTSTRLTFTDSFEGITERLVMTGTFGDYVDGLPTTGTIRRAEYSVTDGESFTFSSLSMSVADFTNFVQTNDSAGLFAALLAGNDRIFGSDSDDVLHGYAGNDLINGGLGFDVMVGMTGDDRYIIDNTGDHVSELAGEGHDTVISTVSYDGLDANVEDLRLKGPATVGGGNELDNEIYGSGAGNLLYGFQGNDILRGYSGKDTLYGGAGNDVIDGGVRTDTLTGHGGADTFVFDQGDTQDTRARADVITDFDALQDDRIHLGGIDADTTADGNQRFTWVADGAFTGAAGQLRYVQDNGTTYIEGDTNGDTIADVVIALTGTVDLAASDFAF